MQMPVGDAATPSVRVQLITPELGAEGLASRAPGYRPYNREPWAEGNFDEDDSPISIHDEASEAAAFVFTSSPGTGVAYSPDVAHRPGSRPSAQRDRNSAHRRRVVKRLNGRQQSTSAAERLSDPRLVTGAREDLDSQVRTRSPDILSAVHAAHSRSWLRRPDLVRHAGRSDEEASVRSRGCGR
jgi:hypothetical protein